MINKICSPEEAVADIFDGATVMVGGFIGIGVPHRLLDALVEQGAKELTVICNSSLEAETLAKAGRIKKIVCGMPGLPSEVPSAVEEQYLAGRLELVTIPQGTILERIRAGGAGVAAFYMSAGVGTVIEQGKEKRVFEDREYILETALRADFALIKGYRGDRYGNLVYRLLARNMNPTMAPAAKVTVAEVEKIVEPGALGPEVIVTPAIFVDRVVQAEKKVHWFKWF